MRWEPSNENYLMYLDKGITKALCTHLWWALKKDVKALCDVEQCSDIEWCVHPGGRGILDALCDPQFALGLNQNMLRNSYDVLDQYGNMSSATILFIIQRMAAEHGPDSKTSAFCIGFGPGLTVEMAALHKIAA
jgi:predicted naringenin-chalcone synthase